jgi:hypothetical protein
MLYWGLRAPGPCHSRVPVVRVAPQTPPGRGENPTRQVEPVGTYGSVPDALGRSRSLGRPGRSSPRPGCFGAGDWCRARGRTTLPTWMSRTGAVRSASICSMLASAGIAIRPRPMPYASFAASSMATGDHAWRRLRFRGAGAVRGERTSVCRRPARRSRRAAHDPGCAGRPGAAWLPPAAAEEDTRPGHPPVVRQLFRSARGPLNGTRRPLEYAPHALPAASASSASGHTMHAISTSRLAARTANSAFAVRGPGLRPATRHGSGPPRCARTSERNASSALRAQTPGGPCCFATECSCRSGPTRAQPCCSGSSGAPAI